MKGRTARPGEPRARKTHAATETERQIIVAILRVGLLASIALMAFGLGLAIGEARLRSHPVALGDVLRFLGHGRPSGFMAAGVLVLVATPVVRVLALAGIFAMERDWRFAVVAIFVALIIGLGIVLGHA